MLDGAAIKFFNFPFFQTVFAIFEEFSFTYLKERTVDLSPEHFFLFLVLVWSKQKQRKAEIIKKNF